MKVNKSKVIKLLMNCEKKRNEHFKAKVKWFRKKKYISILPTKMDPLEFVLIFLICFKTEIMTFANRIYFNYLQRNVRAERLYFRNHRNIHIRRNINAPRSDRNANRVIHLNDEQD